MNDVRNPVYRGKGFVLKGANKEYIDEESSKSSIKKRKKYMYIDKKKNIFNKYNPVVLPLLSRNCKTKKNGNIVEKDIDVLNEGEINSFLLRNKAFRLTWSCIIKQVRKEIDIQITKNLSSVFEEIYLYSKSDNQYLPLILMTAGTNVADHEVIIDTLSYELKRWNYQKEKRARMHSGDDEGKREGNCPNGSGSGSDCLGGDGNAHRDPRDDDDIYVCSLNSSTSNNVNSAICNIYNQLYKEYKMRSVLMKCRGKRVRWNNHKGDVIRISPRRSGSNGRGGDGDGKGNGDDEGEEEGIPLSHLSWSKCMESRPKMVKKTVNMDNLVELYKNMSELNRKKDLNGEKSVEKGRTDLYSIYEEIQERNDELLEHYGELEVYNKKNDYFVDGRKKVRILILVHDCEYFNINILNGILNVLINLRIDYKLCLSVILGVSTPSFFFNRITTPDTQSKLRIKTVDILNNKLVCENICNNLLFENILPFILNFRTMHAIKVLLHKNNQSISHLIHILYILTKEFYDNNLFSFLALPMSYYLKGGSGKGRIRSGNKIARSGSTSAGSRMSEFRDDRWDGDSCSGESGHGNALGDDWEVSTEEYSPYTFVRSNHKTFSNYVKYDVRVLHRKIISLCYSSNLYYTHLSFLKKKYSAILVQNYYTLHGKDSIVHTPTNSDNDLENFTLKRKKKDKKASVGECKKVESPTCEKKNNTSLVAETTILDSKDCTDYYDRKYENGGRSMIKSEKTGISSKEGDYTLSSVVEEVPEVEEVATAEEIAKAEDEERTVASSHEGDSSNLNKTKKIKVEEEKAKEKGSSGTFDRNLYAWQFKANTINWWFDHPFKDLVYLYENEKMKTNIKKDIDTLSDNVEESKRMQQKLHDINSVKEINKYLCEEAIPKCMLQLIERKYAFNIAINLINIILKCKSEYTNSIKRVEYFKKCFENFEKVRSNENKNILHIEEIYKVVENDVKKCINFLIDIITPYYFKNQEILLEILKEFKRYYTKIYAMVYNLEDYLYLLKEKEFQKDKEIFMNDDFSKNFSYSFSYSLYYSLLFKIDDLIEMVRIYIHEQKMKIHPNLQSGGGNSSSMRDTRGDANKGNEDYMENGDGDNHMERKRKCNYGEKIGVSKKKVFMRYLTIQNNTLCSKDNDKMGKEITLEDLSHSLNVFIHDYLYLLLLPPMFYHPLAYDLIIHKPDKEFTDIMTRDIRTELLQTLCYTSPYKTGSLMCSCCFVSDNPPNSDFNTNIVCDNKIFLNPYYDNLSTLEDLVNMYRIYERSQKTVDLYNLFIFFVNIKIDKFLGYSVEDNVHNHNQVDYSKHVDSKMLGKGPLKEKENPLYAEMLQEYYLKFIIAVHTFCSFFKILKPPNVSALLNYTEKDCDNFSDDYGDDATAKGETYNSEESISRFLADIKKSLQGCTSKKLLFGKLYYNQTIMSRELCLQKMVQYNSDYKEEIPCANGTNKRQKK
ncbi:conserved Plasmodium protein, unknown function [Plasmodium ovale]|uniref:Origin recognition complex subunit 3 N-terminal domain-containing protein n=2 Tax=Plasmodium ovale TaxID=36330 RepID=A0A1A8VUJ6_PLAOA|nr:conserved Plasmodium protein, unknown function [Plasmodium ovale curtisi]SCP03929.1 conserved Plasmodium protein, unknown function [Plasmodium ovale]